MSGRIDGRAVDELRHWSFQPGFLKHPLASVLACCGNTQVSCAVSVKNKVPSWMKAQKVPGGWITCEYGMLPAATGERTKREASAGKQSGRTMEIQRLIGRSVRTMVDLKKLGEFTFYCDCDVINADGGTRCAGITGSSLALEMAARSPEGCGFFPEGSFREGVAAVSVGIVDGVPMLDLCYEEDSAAEVDMNVIMTASGKIVEIQGTAEGKVFSRSELNDLLDLAEHGLKEIFRRRNEVLEAFLNGKK